MKVTALTLTRAELVAIRQTSAATAIKFGYTTNAQLPLLQKNFSIRSVSDLGSRMLCISAILWRAAGMTEEAVLAWLEQENLSDKITIKEREYLAEPEFEPTMSARADALFALAWCGSLVSGLDFWHDCPDTLVELFPDIRTSERAEKFRTSIAIRNAKSIIAACDLAYCIHWSVQDHMIFRRPVPGTLHPVYLVERRRALEWMIGGSDWDEVTLDT
jgi:hypothetical protein